MNEKTRNEMDGLDSALVFIFVIKNSPLEDSASDYV